VRFLHALRISNAHGGELGGNPRQYLDAFVRRDSDARRKTILEGIAAVEEKLEIVSLKPVLEPLLP